MSLADDIINNYNATVAHFRLLGDGVSGIIVISSIVGWLPSIAALLSIIWTLIQIMIWTKKQFRIRKENKKFHEVLHQ